MLKTTKDINKIITCSVFLPEPGEEVVKGILADYALLAASHRRLVDAVKAENKAGEIWQVCKAIDERNAALAEAEELIKKEG